MSNYLDHLGRIALYCRIYTVGHKKRSNLLWSPMRRRCGHYIFTLWYLLLLLILSSSFPRLISAVAAWMSTVLLHIWCGLSANLECMSEMCCTARWIYRTQNDAKNRRLHVHHRTNLSGYIFATMARIDNRKKLVKQQCLFHMSAQYGELQPIG